MKEKYSLYHFVCNPEIRRQLFLYFGAGAGIGMIGFLFFAKAAAFVVFVWAAAGLFHFAEDSNVIRRDRSDSVQRGYSYTA